jgi:DNA-directed RNA polymerase specialized sigma24 family protein
VPDAALVTASDALLEAVDRARTVLDDIRGRTAGLRERWAGGESVAEVVASEEETLVVVLLSQVLEDLSAAGSAFRRAEARALHEEGLSQEAIAALFGVTRQRVGALLSERRSGGGRRRDGS